MLDKYIWIIFKLLFASANALYVYFNYDQVDNSFIHTRELFAVLGFGFSALLITDAVLEYRNLKSLERVEKKIEEENAS